MYHNPVPPTFNKYQIAGRDEMLTQALTLRGYFLSIHFHCIFCKYKLRSEQIKTMKYATKIIFFRK